MNRRERLDKLSGHTKAESRHHLMLYYIRCLLVGFSLLFATFAFHLLVTGPAGATVHIAHPLSGDLWGAVAGAAAAVLVPEIVLYNGKSWTRVLVRIGLSLMAAWAAGRSALLFISFTTHVMDRGSADVWSLELAVSGQWAFVAMVAFFTQLAHAKFRALRKT